MLPYLLKTRLEVLVYELKKLEKLLVTKVLGDIGFLFTLGLGRRSLDRFFALISTQASKALATSSSDLIRNKKWKWLGIKQ
jgi:hypothetical protein